MIATEFAGGSQGPIPGTSNAGGSGGTDRSVARYDTSESSTYHLKWIRWNSGKIPIIMQSINGPCPLIATMNVLLLREKIKLPQMLEQITANQLLSYIGECIMDCMPAEIENDENAILNFEQNIHDAIEVLPKLKTGLDVNLRFMNITDFEYTPECIIFDLLRIPLYHGWLIDPSLVELKNAIGNQSYNQLVDNIITSKTSNEADILPAVLIAEEFLERTASQLTLHGLNQLRSKIKDNEIGILFRNNHFLTVFKRESEIYTLVTDHGYLTEDRIIWEILDNIEGAGMFFDSNFEPSEFGRSHHPHETVPLYERNRDKAFLDNYPTDLFDSPSIKWEDDNIAELLEDLQCKPGAIQQKIQPANLPEPTASPSSDTLPIVGPRESSAGSQSRRPSTPKELEDLVNLEEPPLDPSPAPAICPSETAVEGPVLGPQVPDPCMPPPPHIPPSKATIKRLKDKNLKESGCSLI